MVYSHSKTSLPSPVASPKHLKAHPTLVCCHFSACPQQIALILCTPSSGFDAVRYDKQYAPMSCTKCSIACPKLTHNTAGHITLRAVLEGCPEGKKLGFLEGGGGVAACQKWLGSRLEGVGETIRGRYCRLHMPFGGGQLGKGREWLGRRFSPGDP